MTGWRRWAFVAAVLAQALVVIGFVAREELYRSTGREILVRTEPVDPDDPLRGQYFVLGYRFQRLSTFSGNGSSGGPGTTVYVELREQGRYWEPVRSHRSLPTGINASGAVFIKGSLRSAGFAEFPDLSRYYVEQGTPPPPVQPDAVLAVRDDGTARIVRLEVFGDTWP